MTTDFLAIDEWSESELSAIFTRAIILADRWIRRQMPKSLEGVRVALITDDTGWRNTTAFELGVASMGGICTAVPVSLGGKEAIDDLANYLDNWFDILVVRTRDMAKLRELAATAKAPVINARTRSNHPCEVIGDLTFALNEGRILNGLKVSVIAPDDNILSSWMEAAAVLPIEVVQIFPQSWHSERVSDVPRFSATSDLAAIASSDIVVTDCWPQDVQDAQLLPFQVTADLLNRYAPRALFIPCPPVTKGQEVSNNAMLSPQCRAIEAKTFLLHAQNALLETIVDSLKRA